MPEIPWHQTDLRKRKPTVTVFVYIVLCLIWGSTWMAIKLGLSDAPPFWSASVRFLLAIAILFVILRVRGTRLSTQKSDWLVHTGPGFLMYGVSYGSVYLAEQYISSSLTAVLFGTFPIFVALISHWVLPSDRLRGLAWPGMAVGMAGVVVISWHSLELSGDLFVGAMLGVLAPLASATGVVLHKRHAVKVDIVAAATMQMLLGILILLGGAITTESFSEMHWTAMSVGSIIYLAVLGTVIGFLGYYWLMTHISVVSAAMIAFVTPLVASLIGVFFFDESFSTPTAVGGAMILFSVALVTWSRRPVAPPLVVAEP